MNGVVYRIKSQINIKDNRRPDAFTKPLKAKFRFVQTHPRRPSRL